MRKNTFIKILLGLLVITWLTSFASVYTIYKVHKLEMEHCNRRGDER